MIPWALASCTRAPTAATDPGEVPVLVIDSASSIGGVDDLSCRALPPVAIQLSRDGKPVRRGDGGITIDAPDVVAGSWTCETVEGPKVRVERTLAAPGGNLLLLILDDVGIDNLASYGVAPDAANTPRLDALAASGVRFDVAWALPLCSPTRAALITGRMPRRTGAGTLIDREDSYALPLDEVTIPEILATAGWASAHLGKWHLAPAREEFLTHAGEQGFGWHAGSHENLGVRLPNSGDGPSGYSYWQKNTNGVAAWTDVYATTDTVDDTLVQAATLPEPWFLHVGFNAAHTPYDVPPAALVHRTIDVGAPLSEQYDVVLEALDQEIGRLLDGLGEALLARTTVVVLGDNGTPDHAITPPFDPGRGKGTMLEGGVRVPFFVTGPHVAVPGSVSDAFVNVTDVLPTAAAIAGVALDDGIVRDGISLLPWLADPDRPGARAVHFAEKFEPNGFGPYTSHRKAVKSQTHRLVRRSDGTYWFFAAPAAALDEGPELLALGPLSAADQAAFDSLVAILDAFE